MQTSHPLSLFVTALTVVGWAAPVSADNAAMPHQMNGMAIHQQSGSVFGEPGKASEVDRVVTITMHDLSFEPAKLHLRPGETIRFVIKNVSSIDHDFTIGDAATQAEHRREMSEAMAAGTMHHHDSANAVIVEAGKTRELIWKFPNAGRFEFDCNVPGHYEAGMRGLIFISAENRK